MMYCKVKFGYGEADYAQITEEELPRAYGMFLTGEGKSVFSDGTAIRARDIIRIEPDWHRVKGWNRGYKMMVDDWNDVKPLQPAYQRLQADVKMLVEHALRTGKLELLNKPLSQFELPKKNKTKSITGKWVEKFKV